MPHPQPGFSGTGATSARRRYHGLGGAGGAHPPLPTPPQSPVAAPAFALRSPPAKLRAGAVLGLPFRLTPSRSAIDNTKKKSSCASRVLLRYLCPEELALSLPLATPQTNHEPLSIPPGAGADVTRTENPFSFLFLEVSQARPVKSSLASLASPVQLAQSSPAQPAGTLAMNIEALCAAPPEALTHSPIRMPLSCPVAPQAARNW